MAEELVLALCCMYTERWSPIVSAVTLRDIVRRNVIHALMPCPYSHSDVRKRVRSVYRENQDFDAVLREVSTAKYVAVWCVMGVRVICFSPNHQPLVSQHALFPALQIQRQCHRVYAVAAVCCRVQSGFPSAGLSHTR